MSELGKRIRQRREQLDMTQKDLAHAIESSSPRISEIETGVVRHPRIDTLAKIALALGISVDLLWGKSAKPTQSNGQ